MATHIYYQQKALLAFTSLLNQSRWRTLGRRLGKQSSHLRCLEQLNHRPYQLRRFRGVQSIPTRQIIGSVNRAHDFDPDFRPVTQSLRDRWVNAYLLAHYLLQNGLNES